jgi:hypothetical protein
MMADRELQNHRGVLQTKDPSQRLSDLVGNLQEFYRRFGLLQTVLVALLSSSSEVSILFCSCDRWNFPERR